MDRGVTRTADLLLIVGSLDELSFSNLALGFCSGGGSFLHDGRSGLDIVSPGIGIQRDAADDYARVRRCPRDFVRSSMPPSGCQGCDS